MSMSPLRNLLWTIVALAAMVLLAPATASAHDSHRSLAQVTASHAAHEHHAAAPVGFPGHLSEQAATASGFDFPDHDAACTAGCCFGVGCCAGTIVAEGQTLTLPIGPPLRVLGTARPLASARLTSFLKPPKTLA